MSILIILALALVSICILCQLYTPNFCSSSHFHLWTFETTNLKETTGSLDAYKYRKNSW